jgi:hypothetical protein
MPKTQMNCPQCRQPIVADVNQLFDVGQNPEAKRVLLSGMFNIAQCPHCGYAGNLATPIVYHDPEKELLLTYFPPELGMTMDQQERTIGPLIQRVVDNLPQEQRKGYLLRPQTMLTLQSMIETILEADGITKEMIEDQQKRMRLIERLMEASEDARVEMIEAEDAMIDAEFFAIFSRLLDAAIMSRNQDAARRMNDLQLMLMEYSTYGQELYAEMQEVEEAVKSIQESGEELTREKLLDLVINAPSEVRVRALVRLARPGMDYTFFQMLSERIDRARGKGRQRLIDLREQLLALTAEVDEEMEARVQLAHRNLEALLQVDDVFTAVQQNLGAIDQVFIQVVTSELEAARKAGDLERSSKLQQVVQAIDDASTPPPEVEFINELMDVALDENALEQTLAAKEELISDQLVEMLTGLVMQVQSGLNELEGDEKEQQQDAFDRLQRVYNTVLKMKMEKSFKNG